MTHRERDKSKVEEGRDDFPIFIHSELDDYGLSCAEFRVYGRVARRAGGGGEHLESAPHMAAEFGVSEATVRRALKLLVLCNLLSKTIRPGKTTTYRLQPRRAWLPRHAVEEIRRRVLHLKDGGNETHLPLSPQTGVGVSSQTGVENTPVTTDGSSLSSQTGVPLSPQTDEGTPSEGTPLKVLPTHTHVLDSPSRARDPNGGVCVSSEDAPTEDDYYEFARSTKSFHSPDAWAQVHWPLRDADRLIREWKEANKPEAVKARREQPPDNGMSFHVAVAHIESILSAYPRTNVSELIATLSLSDEVRARLAERFSSRAAEPEAAAGSSRQYRTRAP